MLEIDRKQFSRALDLAASVVETRATIPVLTSLKATANGRFRIEATDLDTSVAVEVDYTGDHGSFCIPEPRRLRTAINAVGGAAVLLAPAGEDPENPMLSVDAGGLRCALNTHPADHHPGVSGVDREDFLADIGQAELAQIKRITPAISVEETRYYLNGVCVSYLGDWLYRFVATNGHILMIADVPLPNATGQIPEMTILPKRWVNLVLQRFGKAKEPVRFTFGATVPRNAPEPVITTAPNAQRIAMSSDLQGLRLSVHSKLIDGKYPDFNKVIPVSHQHGARINRGALLRALNALSSFASDKARALMLVFHPGKIEVTLRTPIIGDTAYTIDAEHDLPAAHRVGFNGEYLLSAIQALRGDEVHLGTDSEPHSPSTITDPTDTTFKVVLMPMRVDC